MGERRGRGRGRREGRDKFVSFLAGDSVEERLTGSDIGLGKEGVRFNLWELSRE